jgi:hypothetical protein
MHVHIYASMYLCERWAWACSGCTASNAHVRAIARADDATVAITCARGYVRRYIANAHVIHTHTYIYIHSYRYIYIDAKSWYVNGYACMFLHARAIACGR